MTSTKHESRIRLARVGLFLLAVSIGLTGCNQGAPKPAAGSAQPSDGDVFGENVDATAPDNINPIQAGGLDNITLVMEKDNTVRFLASGGSAESEAAVQAGLKWLLDHQLEDGSWALRHKKDSKNCTCKVIHGPELNPIAATAFAILPFIARGETHKGSEILHGYAKPIDRGIRYLLSQQNPDGSFKGMGPMYTMGVATMALCEDYHMSGCDPILKTPCEKAIKFIIDAQTPRLGGWRYSPRDDSDLSVTSWQLQALKSGQMAGLHPPREILDNARKFLKRVGTPNEDGYGYQQSVQANPARTAYGMLCRQYIDGGSFTTPEATRGLDRLLSQLPSTEPRQMNMYYYYYATQVIFNIGGEPWKTWNPRMQKLLIDTQDKGTNTGLAHQKGSWDPVVYYPRYVRGRIMCTSLALLTLEVYYRYTPLNRPELGDMKKPELPKK